MSMPQDTHVAWFGTLWNYILDIHTLPSRTHDEDKKQVVKADTAEGITWH